MNTNWTRRHFLEAAAALSGLAAARQQPAAPALTAGEVIDRIKGHVGIPWRAQTVDTIVAGTAATPVRGIATTMMATLDVLQRARGAGMNMVITHESTFFSHQDRTDNLADDPTYLFKRDFLARHGMVVFHFHDHWHGRRPDGIAVGMMQALGWERYANPENPRRFVVPTVPLRQFAQQIRERLEIRVLRVVGDPEMPVSRVTASWGNVSLFPGIPFLSDPETDVLVVGETREWELVEYAQDLVASGKKKALVILGHVVSEQAGMRYCAEWLRTFVTEVPVEFVAAPEPYWSPAASATGSARSRRPS